MSEEVPVTSRDLLVLAAVSLGGSILLTMVMAPIEFSPQFFSIVFATTMLLTFFLFVPVMGVRLFIDDRNEE